jgi:hypothetical protein
MCLLVKDRMIFRNNILKSKRKTILKYFFQIKEYYGKYGVLYLLNVNNILNDFKKTLFY